MPGQQVKIRPVQNVQAVANVRTLQRDYNREIFMHGLGMANETVLCVACIFFFEFMPKRVYITGVFLWIVGCIFGTGVSIFHMVEYQMARSKYRGQVRHEMLELVLYLICHLLFLGGSVLYLPWLYTTQGALMWGHAVATWLWIWGSIALIIAGHWNAIGIIEESTRLPVCRRTVLLRRTASVALTCTAIGAAVFFAGSFLFRPGFKNECESPEAFVPAETVEAVTTAIGRRMKMHPHRFANMIEPDLLPAAKAKARGGAGPEAVAAAPGDYELNTWCVSIIEQGTLLYLVGCLAFWLNSLLSTACSMILHKIRLEESHVEYTKSCKRQSMVGRVPLKGQGVEEEEQDGKAEAESVAGPAPDSPEKSQGVVQP